MRPVILTAGKATRAGSYAPDGCKALVNLNGKPIIEHQLDVLDAEPIIVCRTEHAHLLAAYGQVVINDAAKGPADALLTALPHVTEPIVVVYADTYFTDLPDGTDWVGVAHADGGRKWDVIRDGYAIYEHVAEGWTAKVAVGLYAFSEPQRLVPMIERLALRHAVSMPDMGLAPVLNVCWPWREEPIPSWRDVGSVEAIEAFA